MKKETSFHWYKEDDEIVPETPVNVMSGAVALPVPMVTTAASTPTHTSTSVPVYIDTHGHAGVFIPCIRVEEAKTQQSYNYLHN